jgi:hypothetical protein
VSGEFALIETDDVENSENSRLYLWNGSQYSYVTDLSGATGITGPQGFQGDAGAQGFQGDIGAQGFQGDIGAQGSQGFQGVQGAPGEGKVNIDGGTPSTIYGGVGSFDAGGV